MLVRSIVEIFNGILRECVLAEQPRLRWLEFVEELVDPPPKGEYIPPEMLEKVNNLPSILGKGSKLKPQYALDGTHIHPCYIPLLQSAIDASFDV